MSASKEYEEAKASAVEEVAYHFRQARARHAADYLFGGTPEQREETYRKLMETQAPTPD